MSSSFKRSFAEDKVADYERRRYRGLDQRIVHRRELQILRRIFSLIEKHTTAQTPGYVLDAPCGYGRFSSLILSRGYRLVSLDLSPAMVRRAHAGNLISVPPVGIVADVVQGLPFRANTFPIILSIRFLHHLHDAAFRRLVLKEFVHTSSSWLILSYYQASLLHLLQRNVRRTFKRNQARIKMITRSEFESDTREAGFEIVRIIPLFRGIHAHHIALLRKTKA